MARPPARFSRVSVGFVNSGQTIIDVDAGDTGDIFSVNGATQLTGNVTITGDFLPTGDMTLVGDLVQTGAATISESLGVGGGTALTGLSVTSVNVDFGELGISGGQSTTTVGVAGATDGDILLVTLPSIWSVADYQVNVTASSGDTTGEVNLTALNSGLTAVNPTAGNFQILRIGV